MVKPRRLEFFVRHLFTAAEAERALDIKAATIRQWAKRQKLYSMGLDERGRPMYDRDHLVALRDREGDLGESA